MHDCPYCEKPISGPGVLFGVDLLHSECLDRLGEDLEAAFSATWPEEEPAQAA